MTIAIVRTGTTTALVKTGTLTAIVVTIATTVPGVTIEGQHAVADLRGLIQPRPKKTLTFGLEMKGMVSLLSRLEMKGKVQTASSIPMRFKILTESKMIMTGKIMSSNLLGLGLSFQSRLEKLIPALEPKLLQTEKILKIKQILKRYREFIRDKDNG